MRILVSGSTAVTARLASAWPNHLGFLLTPGNRNSVSSIAKTSLPMALDNGAYSGFDAQAFRRKLERATQHPRLLWVACPDVVGDAEATLTLFGQWEPELCAAGVRVAFVGQDRAEGLSRIPWDSFDAWFIGGSTEWKLSRASAVLAAEAKRRGKWVHMGRVNTLRRLRLAHEWGCDSVDGSSYSRWAASARAKGRTDMLLERHLAYVAALEGQRQTQPSLW